MTTLNEGDVAPDFELKDQDGNLCTLTEQKGHKTLIYFYPKADTPGCTKQSCGLRDVARKVGDTAIIGISPDKPSDQKKFDQKYSLGFPLLADTDHLVADDYGVWGERSMYGKTYMGINRSAFLVDENGNLEKVWYRISPDDTPKNLLKALGL
jgi:thioredoxin-dependent peroxiredoxin